MKNAATLRPVPIFVKTVDSGQRDRLNIPCEKITKNYTQGENPLDGFAQPPYLLLPVV